MNRTLSCVILSVWQSLVFEAIRSRRVDNQQRGTEKRVASMFRQLAIRPYKRSSLSVPGKSSPICLPNGGDQPSFLHASVEQLESRMTMEMKKGVRIRLCFDEAGILTPQQVDQGLSKCWILVHNYILTIGQLAAHIAAKFDLQRSCRDGLSLEVRTPICTRPAVFSHLYIVIKSQFFCVHGIPRLTWWEATVEGG